jgi:hypothetical protein
MKKPALELFDPLHGLTAIALAEQVRKNGYVVFDAPRPQASNLKSSAVLLLEEDGVEVEGGISHWAYYTHFIFDASYGYERDEFSQWVTELCEKNLSTGT